MLATTTDDAELVDCSFDLKPPTLLVPPA